MADKPLTHDDVLQAVLDYVSAGMVRPPDSVTVNELVEQAKKKGVKLARTSIQSRMDRMVDEGKLEKIKVGGRAYYRMVKE